MGKSLNGPEATKTSSGGLKVAPFAWLIWSARGNRVRNYTGKVSRGHILPSLGEAFEGVGIIPSNDETLGLCSQGKATLCA